MKKADYGLDAPAIVHGLTFGGAAGLLAAVLLARQDIVIKPLYWLGGMCLIEGLWMRFSSAFGKLRMRDRLLDGLALKGDERVLDVGCGHGLLLLGAARRLTNGKAVGIDLWSQTDQAHNSRQATLENAQAEGVESKVELADGDMRKLPFEAASFGAAVASLSIHNIKDRAGRKQAIEEIHRVLAPGGKVALLDFQHVGQYADDLRALGFAEVKVSFPSLWMFPPVRVVTAVRS